MRFSLAHSQGTAGIEETLLLNLSQTGLAFLASREMGLSLGEKIKVEIPIPAGDQIAWWATVVRIQEYEVDGWFVGRDSELHKHEDKVYVGLRFDDLPEKHERAIKVGIEKSFMQAMRDQQYRNLMYYRTLAIHNIGKVLLYSALTAMAFALLYYLSRPDANYDAKRGSPWGHRFEF